LCNEEYSVDDSSGIIIITAGSCATGAATSRGQHSREKENVENTTGRKLAIRQMYKVVQI